MLTKAIAKRWQPILTATNCKIAVLAPSLISCDYINNICNNNGSNNKRQRLRRNNRYGKNKTKPHYKTSFHRYDKKYNEITTITQAFLADKLGTMGMRNCKYDIDFAKKQKENGGDAPVFDDIFEVART